MSTFEDTEWDVPSRGDAESAALERSCKKFAVRVRKPIYFPIIPLESTLARARAEADALRNRIYNRKSAGRYNPTEMRQSGKATVVDGRGRTRAASRMSLAVKTAKDDAPEGADVSQTMKGLKRKRAQEPDTDAQEIKKLRESS